MFLEKLVLYRHNASVHEGTKPFKYDLCDTLLNKHAATVHKETKLFKCNLCDATFKQKGNLKRYHS